ncbi:hypothetical protein C8J42_10912 [Sphingomonas sp. PP-CE-1A-559]|jgi:hypothetical protein|nr:hypothetical protein C8J42_10912 [Sphingomonas sp. PP-CE-1A-559]
MSAIAHIARIATLWAFRENLYNGLSKTFAMTETNQSI